MQLVRTLSKSASATEQPIMHIALAVAWWISDTTGVPRRAYERCRWIASMPVAVRASTPFTRHRKQHIHTCSKQMRVDCAVCTIDPAILSVHIFFGGLLHHA